MGGRNLLPVNFSASSSFQGKTRFKFVHLVNQKEGEKSSLPHWAKNPHPLFGGRGAYLPIHLDRPTELTFSCSGEI